MKRVLIPLAPGFEEIEAVTLIDILRRAGITVDVAGTISGPIQASRGVQVLPDIGLDEALAREYDLVVLPGGAAGTENLMKDPRVDKILSGMIEKGKYVGAICAAPSILAARGVLAGRAATSHPSVEAKVREGKADYRTDRVVSDGRFLTSRSPGTAMEFAFTLVELLVGSEKAKEINGSVMAKL
ncbi:MAG TPA: DJ-1 family glyoxalase III [Nitrospiria bacterium]|nr:DJ-1 family glyoxalase III [Nitrospiria bacterium]